MNVVGLILCIVANYVCCYFAAQNYEGKNGSNKTQNKANTFFVASIILSIIAAILLIQVIDSSNNGGAVGKYTYYVNGKKISSSTYAATQNFGIGFMFFILLFGSGMSIAANIIKKKNNPKSDNELKKPNMVAFVFSIISLVFGLMLIITSILTLANILQKNSDIAPIISLFLAILLIALGIWGIRVYIKRKKLNENK